MPAKGGPVFTFSLPGGKPRPLPPSVRPLQIGLELALVEKR